MAETMIASGMTDGQIDTIVDKLRAALRKHRDEIPSEVAQRVNGVENLGMECFAVVRAHADRLRNIVRFTIAAAKEFVKPDWIREITKGNESREPGDYEYTFEGFLRAGESSVKGDEMVRRAGVCSGLQDALYFLDNQDQIPVEFRGKKYLVFPNAEALDSDDGRDVACLDWGGGRWVLIWRWLGIGFASRVLLVRARKVS